MFRHRRGSGEFGRLEAVLAYVDSVAGFSSGGCVVLGHHVIGVQELEIQWANSGQDDTKTQ